MHRAYLMMYVISAIGVVDVNLTRPEGTTVDKITLLIVYSTAFLVAAERAYKTYKSLNKRRVVSTLHEKLTRTTADALKRKHH